MWLLLIIMLDITLHIYIMIFLMMRISIDNVTELEHFTGMDKTCVYTSFYGFICVSGTRRPGRVIFFSTLVPGSSGQRPFSTN